MICADSPAPTRDIGLHYNGYRPYPHSRVPSAPAQAAFNPTIHFPGRQ